MMIEFELQNASEGEAIPDAEEFRKWLGTALEGRGEVSLAVRVVDAHEMQVLNSRYRGQHKATNVLSFPAGLPPSVKDRLDEPEPLGDIVICAPVVEAEARAQGKPLADHWAHLTIHGLLHLLGHDHQEAGEARAMEALEIQHLSALGIPDPYRESGGAS